MKLGNPPVPKGGSEKKGDRPGKLDLGVSHDIRTPLSMVLGYAAQMEEDPGLSPQNRKKMAIIRQQGLKMKNLINDLNLASKLEYHMQPLSVETVSLRAIVRQCAADFINSDLEGKYPLTWQDEAENAPCRIQGDKALLCRAVNNVLNNCVSHNPEGCAITVTLGTEKGGCFVAVEDNGRGISRNSWKNFGQPPTICSAMDPAVNQDTALAF